MAAALKRIAALITAARDRLSFSRRQSVVAAATGLLVMLVGVVALLVSGPGQGKSSTKGSADVGAPTALAVRRDLSEKLDVDATLSFGDARTVITRAAGILTAIAGAGVVIEPGQPLYALDGTPVVLLNGTLPATRDFVEGMSDGPDVAELERNLAQLGCDPHKLLIIDSHFAESTRAAIENLQRRLGTAVTGELALGTMVFLPGERRVTTVYGQAGSAVAPGTRVLDTAATSRVATVTLDTSQRSLISIGGPVDVLLPDGTSVDGTVSSIGGTANVDPNADPSSAASTVTVIVSIGEHLKEPDGTPVVVRITTEMRRHVLSVPVTTLLAQSGGRRAVEVVTADGSTHLVSVHAGLYAGGYVQISGKGIRPGTRVLDAPAT